MYRYSGYLLLASLVFLLGREVWLGQPKVLVGPGFAAVSTQTGNRFFLGDLGKLSQFQPFGYFFDPDDLSKPVTWTKDFVVIEFEDRRLFWFGPNFSWSEVSKLLVSLDSNIWLVSESVDFGQMPSPQQSIVWLHPSKRLPKKLKELGAKIIDVQKAGIVTLELID